ncbi:MAG: 4Fe-4S dicluster domain-containing protein [Sedimentisphaerales bacterium]|nr:4Fe-4S dicluster domain-containing protein [Sedimentisphaerales bacterium]
MSAKLIIDLARTKLQEESQVRCSYKHHPGNKGLDALLEMVRFALICRRCEGAPCVVACPQGALEKVPSETNDAGVLKRANMLCTGCGTCAIACPFGTIYTDLIPFPSSVCDLCRGRLQGGEKPLCVQTCDDGSIDYGPADPGDDRVEVFDSIVVKVAGGSTWEPFVKSEEEAEK